MISIALPCGRTTQIDEEDQHKIIGFRLHAERRGCTFYVRLRTQAQRGGGKYLHNVLMGGRTDHKDGNGLNNVRSNLRPCTQAQNCLNRAAKRGKRFKGVYRDRTGKFYAQIYINQVARTVHGFVTEELAAREYDRLALELHGEWARLNFPLTEPDFQWMDRADGRQKGLF